jgi:hypothetical protein
MLSGGGDHTLVALPDSVLVQLLRFLDPLSLNLASQTCVALLRCASALEDSTKQPKMHFVVRAAKACIGSILHLPHWALECCLDFSQSLRFPIYLAMHGLRSSLAATDVYDVAERTARSMQVGTP